MSIEISGDNLENLIKKYSGPGPRYTSYPTAVELRESVIGSSITNQKKAIVQDWGEIWQELLREDNQGVLRLALNRVCLENNPRSYSIYIHIPFCHSLCYYCACNKYLPKDRAIVGQYLQALDREMCLLAEVLPRNISIEQIHWGGGSPNFLTPDEMEQLHITTLRHFPNLQAQAEVSLEVDPRTTSKAQLEMLRNLGFNRISLGVQDFDPLVQETINRVQTLEETKKVLDIASALSFSGINIDLVYGLPNQTLAGFERTLEEVISLRPSRMAVYGYAHVTWKEKVQKVFENAKLPSPEERIAIFCAALNRFAVAGYKYIGMDHFALPEDALAVALASGKLSRNFMGYTPHAGARVLGIGASSISSLPNLIVQNVKEVSQYIDKLEKQQWPTARGLHKTFDDCIRADLIQRILCVGEVNLSDFEEQWDIQFENYFQRALLELEQLRSDGLVDITAFKLELTPMGRLFARNVAMCFDAYLKVPRTQQKVFSQTV